MTKPLNLHPKNNQKRQFKPNFDRNRIQKNDRRNNTYNNNKQNSDFHRRNNHNNNNNRKAPPPKQQVNDRNRSQPNNQVAQVKLPLFDKSRLQQRWVSAQRVGPGLINGQNTCFLNSVLQCLTYTPPLAQYLLSSNHKKQCKMTSYCALCAMETHVYRVFKEAKGGVRGAAILPKYFTANLQALSRTLRLRRQEDSHEFLMFLFTAFQKSLLNGLGKVSPKVEESTMLHGIFGGRVQSQVRCHSCQARSNTYEAFLDLSVDIHRASSLDKALSNFVKVDLIGGRDPDSKYKCESCNQKVNAGKQVTIRDLPMMLAIHLKRFTFDMERGYMRKVSDRIQYPEVLDMAPYVSAEEKKKIQGKSRYRLYGVLVHLGGSCNSGHYYAYVKNSDGQWYQMDDETVEKASLKEVLSQQAYMLFYARESAAPSASPNNLKNVQESAKQPSLAEKREEVLSKKKDTEHPNEKLQGSVLGKRKDSDDSVDSSSSDSLPVKHSKKAASSSKDDDEDAVCDRRQSWYVRSADLPFRSLRGNLSPPTFSAAISDPSAWTVRSAAAAADDDDITSRKKDEQEKPPKTTVGTKYQKKVVPWTVLDSR